MAFEYPTAFDVPGDLLLQLGSLWYGGYQGNALVNSYCGASLEGQKQLFSDLDALISACSRERIPVYHTENWYELTLPQSQKNDLTYSLTQFGNNDFTFGVGSGLYFGEPQVKPLSAWPLPAGFTDTPLISNRIELPSRTLVRGIDYVINNGFIIFAGDPFADALIPQTPVLRDNVPVDQTISLWAFKATFDRQYIYNQFGYALNFQGDSSEDYKKLVNAFLNSLVEGSVVATVQAAWSAITGIPLARGNETVQVIEEDPDRLLIVTDQNVYTFSPEADAIVTVGQALNPGDPLTDGLLFYEFNAGAVPDADDVPALALGSGFLVTGFFGDLVFKNAAVPLIVTYDTNGYTKLSWEIDGWPGDVEKFFDDLHARGLAHGKTLADLLDQRPIGARDTQPGPGALPATINPLGFLCQNVFRNNLFLVKIRTIAAGSGVGINSAKFMRRVIPPQTAMLVLTELEHTDAPITMAGAGSATAPGYVETVDFLPVMNLADSVNPAVLIAENVQYRQIGGYCV